MTDVQREINAEAKADEKAAQSASADKAPGASKANGASKSTGSKSHRATGRPPGRPKSVRLDDKLQELIGTVGGGLKVAGLVRGNPQMEYDGDIVLANAERLAKALEKAAQESPAVKRTLEMIVTTSTWGEVIGAVVAVGVPIMANHGVLPREAAPLMGADVPPPRPEKAPPPPTVEEVRTVVDLAGKAAASAATPTNGTQPADEVPHRLP